MLDNVNQTTAGYGYVGGLDGSIEAARAAQRDVQSARSIAAGAVSNAVIGPAGALRERSSQYRAAAAHMLSSLERGRDLGEAQAKQMTQLANEFEAAADALDPPLAGAAFASAFSPADVTRSAGMPHVKEFTFTTELQDVKVSDRVETFDTPNAWPTTAAANEAAPPHDYTYEEALRQALKFTEARGAPVAEVLEVAEKFRRFLAGEPEPQAAPPPGVTINRERGVRNGFIGAWLDYARTADKADPATIPVYALGELLRFEGESARARGEINRHTAEAMERRIIGDALCFASTWFGKVSEHGEPVRDHLKGQTGLLWSELNQGVQAAAEADERPKRARRRQAGEGD